MFGILFAQDPAAGGPPPFGAIIMIGLMFVVMYFLIIMPANRQRRQQQEMLSKLQKGDKVATSAGIIGTVITIREDAANEPGEVTIRSDESKIRVLKSTIVSILTRSEESDAKS